MIRSGVCETNRFINRKVTQRPQRYGVCHNVLQGWPDPTDTVCTPSTLSLGYQATFYGHWVWIICTHHRLGTESPKLYTLRRHYLKPGWSSPAQRFTCRRCPTIPPVGHGKWTPTLQMYETIVYLYHRNGKILLARFRPVLWLGNKEHETKVYGRKRKVNKCNLNAVMLTQKRCIQSIIAK